MIWILSVANLIDCYLWEYWHVLRFHKVTSIAYEKNGISWGEWYCSCGKTKGTINFEDAE